MTDVLIWAIFILKLKQKYNQFLLMQSIKLESNFNEDFIAKTC